jgi:hypothetical protein
MPSQKRRSRRAQDHTIFSRTRIGSTCEADEGKCEATSRGQNNPYETRSCHLTRLRARLLYSEPFSPFSWLAPAGPSGEFRGVGNEGISTDVCPATVTQDNVVGHLDAAGISWKRIGPTSPPFQTS